MEFLIIGIVSFLGSGLTLFSGFGLGTILTPVFGLFFPIELAIGLTAIVHLLNNVFKLVLLGRQAHLKTVLRFGIPSLLASLAGAILLSKISTLPALGHYFLFGTQHSLFPVKLIIAVLLIFFALFEIIPALAELRFSSRYLVAGGFISGFFGGLSGNQGALRSAFLIRSDLGKEQFIATGVVIACLVDVSRLGVYSQKLMLIDTQLGPLLLCATLCAFAGAFAGSRLLKKITIKALQYAVAMALMVFGVLLGAGII